MKTLTDIETMSPNSNHPKFSIFKYSKIDGFLLLSEIILKASKHFPIIILSFASLKILLVVNDIYSNNLAFAILNSIFALGDFIFLVQLHQGRKNYQKEFNSFHMGNNAILVEGIAE